MNKQRARKLANMLTKALGWSLGWSGTRLERIPLRQGEASQSETSVELLDMRWWQSRGGCLMVTDQRLLFLPKIARDLPRWCFLPGMEIELGTIRTVENKRHLIRIVWDCLRIELMDGRVYRFSVWDGFKLQRDVLRSRDSLPNSNILLNQ